MGVTIHYSFVKTHVPEELLKKAEVLAKKLGFKIEKRSWNHLLVNPHEESEWIDLHWHKVKTIKESEGWDLEKMIGIAGNLQRHTMQEQNAMSELPSF